MDPEETRRLKGLCPVCGKPVTLGVMYRVIELADRPDESREQTNRFYESLIPLPEILSEILKTGPAIEKGSTRL